MKTRDTDKDWQLIAKEKPYWGVLSEDLYLDEKLNEDSLKTFFETGELYVNNLNAFIKRYIREDFSFRRSLDFGCGVGRLLIPIAKLADEAVGIDVADNMLKIAKKNVELLGLTNVHLVKSDDDLSAIDGQFDFINTYIVLQHIPPKRGYKIITKLIASLKIGGVGSIQLTYCKDKKFWIHEQNNSRFYRRDEDSLIELVNDRVDQGAGMISMFDYDLNQIFALLSIYSGDRLIILPSNHNGHLGIHIIFEKK